MGASGVGASRVVVGAGADGGHNDDSGRTGGSRLANRGNAKEGGGAMSSASGSVRGVRTRGNQG